MFRKRSYVTGAVKLARKFVGKVNLSEECPKMSSEEVSQLIEDMDVLALGIKTLRVELLERTGEGS